MAGPSPAMTMGQDRGLVSERGEGNLHTVAHCDGDAPPRRFIVMAGLVPAIGRGTLPLRMAGHDGKGWDGKGWFHPGRVGPPAGGNSQ